MPLDKGCGAKVRSKNIAEMRRAGHPADQAVAASFENQRRQGCPTPKKKGGRKRKR